MLGWLRLPLRGASMTFLFCSLRLSFMLGRLRLRFVLSRLGRAAFFVMLLCECRNGGAEKQENSCCADDSDDFHKYFLRCCNLVRPVVATCGDWWFALHGGRSRGSALHQELLGQDDVRRSLQLSASFRRNSWSHFAPGLTERRQAIC